MHSTRGIASMKCSTSGCSRGPQQQCSECSRYFCSSHIEKCDFCEAYVCFECRDTHQSSSPQHQEPLPNA